MIMNFIACVGCALCAIFWVFKGNPVLVITELILMAINLPFAIQWCSEKIYWHRQKKGECRMIQMTAFCDVCTQPMRGDKDDTVKIYKTKEWNTKELFPHLCKNCADKLDKAMAKVKNELSYQQAILVSNKKLNDLRKEKMNTKG